MDASRRTILQAIGGVGALGALSACSTAKTSTTASGGAVDMPLWYWGGGMSDKVVQEAAKHFASSAKVSATKVEGDFKQKLTTALAAGTGLPAITGLKGEDIAVFLGVADKFEDLNALGAKDHKKDFVDWKWDQASTKDGKQIGIPIDIGPTAMFYRHDIFEKAGLPTEPAAVSAALATWEDFTKVATTLKDKTGTFLVSSISDYFPIFVGQQANRFVGEDGAFLGESPAIKKAWDQAVGLVTSGLSAKTGKSYETALTQGTLSGDIGAAWHALDIKDSGKGLDGKWKVANHPGVPTNFGGSFLGIPRGFADPKKAFEVILWLLSPENGAKGFADAAIFPASPASYALPELTAGDPYFSGQKTIDIFGPTATKVLKQFTHPADSAVSESYFTELTNVEANGKAPDAAWADAVAAAKQVAQRQGLKV